MDREEYRHYLISVPEHQGPERIDVFLSNRIRHYTRSSIKNLCDRRKILIGSAGVRANYTVKPGEDIYILLPYSSFREINKPVNIPLDILFEDEHCIVVNKPAGIAVHAGLGDYNNTILNGLLFYLNGKGKDEQIYIVHRLDKHTSGPLVFAKTPEACRFISAQFVSDKADRIYHCLVWGCPEKENGTIETFIGRIPHKPECIGVSEDGSFGKRAVTHYRVLKRFSTASLIECRLETGRTHQVRIHMLYNGTPLIGDQRYPGNPGASGEILNKASAVIRHQALHARSLSFANPGDDQRLNFSVGYPQAFLKLMDFLESL